MPANVETMFYVREAPWHGLGIQVESALNSTQALEMSGLNWNVIQKPIMTTSGNLIPGYKANVRDTDNRVLGVVTDRYCGNLTPADRQIVKGSEIARAMEEVDKAATVLEQSLMPDLLPALKRLMGAHITLNALTAETYYIDGFKIGARFMMDVQDDSGMNCNRQ